MVEQFRKEAAGCEQQPHHTQNTREHYWPSPHLQEPTHHKQNPRKANGNRKPRSTNEDKIIQRISKLYRVAKEFLEAYACRATGHLSEFKWRKQLDS